MAEDDKTDSANQKTRGIGTLPLYTLLAVLAAILGFLSVVIVERFADPAPSGSLQLAQANAADSAAPEEAASHGLEKLVRSNKPKTLPEITFSDGDGGKRSLAEWKGKVVLVNLWATWCAPCRVEMPSLDRLQAKLGGDDFAVIPISLDFSGPKKPRKFLEDENLNNLPLYVDSSKTLMQSLNAPGLPLSVLIDREGREIARLAGAAEWDSPEAEELIRQAIDGKGAS